mmetsp:Transcript_79778/g.258469  ORF Transcript_79778/g.258469 Transcript_79778/m.258469 type:complete len:101 (+) Transcript_79778:159-461(+)
MSGRDQSSSVAHWNLPVHFCLDRFPLDLETEQESGVGFESGHSSLCTKYRLSSCSLGDQFGKASEAAILLEYQSLQLARVEQESGVGLRCWVLQARRREP